MTRSGCHEKILRFDGGGRAERERDGSMNNEEVATIGDRMTPDPVVVRSDQTVGETLVILFERDVRHLPVLEKGRLVGIVSDRDIRQFLGRVSLMAGDRRKEDRSLRRPVREIMSPKPVTVGIETPIWEGVKIMADHKVGALPVVDLEGKLVGIYTEWDALRHCLYLMDRYEGIRASRLG